ncbi:MAG: hypothetical protein QOC88_547, partial [Mycobacterium sp.]|nr:hypothetical protein [Mycobacterium sp.]
PSVIRTRESRDSSCTIITIYYACEASSS